MRAESWLEQWLGFIHGLVRAESWLEEWLAIYRFIHGLVRAESWLEEWLAICSLDPRPSDLCILMEGLVRDDHVA